MKRRAPLLLLFLFQISFQFLGACGRSPIGPGEASGSGGSSSGPSGSGGTGGDAKGLPIARLGDDGVCGMTLCPQGQQCCLSTGNCVDPGRAASDCPLPTPPPAICGGVTCSANQICCLLDGKCIDPSTAAATCPKPSGSPGDASTDPSSNGASLPCGSNADCLPTQFCATSASLICLGPGICESRSNCGSSFGTAQYCGCDGVSYADIQTACRAGVRIIATNPCGTPVDQSMPGTSLGPRDPVIYCATSDQCPQGQQCCSITNRCYDASIPYLCTFPPAGTSLSCLEDRQCSGSEFCSGPGCSGPGGCVSPGSCGGELKPVCGCDGKSYTNAACALSAALRIAQQGMCPAGDAGQ